MLVLGEYCGVFYFMVEISFFIVILIWDKIHSNTHLPKQSLTED
jgi:hypothetical protein